MLLTIGVNIASAAAGVLLVFGSVLFLASELLAIGFVWSSPLIVFVITVAAEYAAGVWFFSLPQSWKTVGVIAAANVPTVSLAIYGTLHLIGRAFG